MKELKVIADGSNFTAVAAGSLGELGSYELSLGGDAVLRGKVFAGKALGATGSEISLQVLNPGEGSAFIHSHKTHEELYIVTGGEGEFQIDGKVFAVCEGGIVRVAPGGLRALRCTGDGPMTVVCVQYKAGTFGSADTPFEDGVIAGGGVAW